MLSRKSPFKARPTINKKKLQQLFEEHLIDPDQIYLFKADNGVMKFPNDQEQPSYQQEQQENNNNYNYIPQISSKKKMVGLFANIIKNMEVTKVINRVQPQKKKQQKKTGYQYYFNELQLKANKNKKQKQNIEFESNQLLIHDKQNQFTQIQLRSNKQQILYSENTRIHQNNKIEQVSGKPIDNFVDMNFSFDDISKQLTSIKEKADRQQSRIQEDTIIKKFLDENSKNSYFEGEINFGNSLKEQKMAKVQSIQKKILKQSNKGELINFAKLSKQAKGAPSQLIPPFLAKKFASKNSSKDLQGIFSLEGTKKVESRIVGNDSKNEPNNINIDFDLDINFI